MPIFYLKGLNVSQFDKYAKLINELSTAGLNINSVRPGARLERLTSHVGIDLYSVRLNHWARLIFTLIQDGPYKGHIVLCAAADDHNYDDVLLRLKRQKGQLLGFLPYPDDMADDLTDDGYKATAAAAPLEYAEMHFYGEHCIELNTSQVEVLQTSLPAIIHGAPGTGKTLIGADLAKNYVQNPSMKQDKTATLRALFLFPTLKLAEETQKAYLDSCDFDSIPRAVANLVVFSTYDDFFKNHTQEGRLVAAETSTGFDDFKVWYQKLPHHKKPELKSVKLEAEDCWASFRLCSLFSDVKRYEALSETQCAVPASLRKAIYELYSDYKKACEQGHNYSVWTHPFRCEEQFGLVVLDESHNQSGCTLLSAYNLSQDGQFVALVGDHQKIGAHQSQFGGGCAAVDLLAVLVYEDESAQQARSKIKFKTHMLNQTHRNSETVVEVVNFFVELKLRLGLSTAIKGADCHLNGHNNELGAAQLIIAETNTPDLLALRKEFEGRPDVAILVPASSLEEAIKRWPKSFIFTAIGAMGLEFPYVICDGLLNHGQGSKEVGRLLEKPLTKTATAGHRGKQAADPDALQQEGWFNSLITACSRAQKAVYFVEDKKPQHTARTLFTALDEVCHRRAKKTESQTQQAAPVSAESWLAQALTLLKENTSEMDMAAKRAMDANLDHTCDAYQQFLAQYNRNQQQRAESAPKATPLKLSSSAMSIEATAASPAEPVSKIALATEASTALPIVKKVSQPLAQSKSESKSEYSSRSAPSIKAEKRSRESIYSALLLNDFEEDTLLRALQKCNVITLFEFPSAHEKTETLLTRCFNNEDSRNTFARCCIREPELLTKVLISGLEKIAKKAVGKKLNQLFHGLSRVNEIYKNNPLDNSSPAPLAAAAGDITTLKFLHDIGLSLNQANKEENTLAQVAAGHGQVDVLIYLKSIGVDLNQTDKKGCTLANFATSYGQVDVLIYLSSIGISLNQTDKDGFTLAQSAASKGITHVLQYLHQNGWNMKTIDPTLATPLFLAARNGHLLALQYLLKSNLESSQDLFISTAGRLNVFASTKDVYVQERMRQKITARQHAGDTADQIQLSPLDIAEVMGNLDVVDTLKKHAALKASAAALLMPNGSIFNSGAHQASTVVDELTKTPLLPPK